MTLGRFLAMSFAVSGGALTLTGCHYTEEEKWSVCCVLRIGAYETAPAGARTVINWYRSSDFDGDGSGRSGPYGDGELLLIDKDDKIRLEVARFLAEYPQGRAADYFVGLGMTCGPSTTSKGNMARCEIDLPVWVTCRPTYLFRPLATAPIPERLQKPFGAVLNVGVDLSAKTVLDTSSRVYPTPGGHLCHR